jgi:RNA polymerase sigma-70 factor (ECF subfamily)
VSERLDELDDETLVHRFTEGEVKAFEILMERYKRPVFNFIYRSVRDATMAEELHQEAFLRVIQRSGEFKGESKFSTWLYTIVRNLCIDHSRKMSFRRHRSLDAPSSSGEDDGRTMLDRTEGRDHGSERRAIANQLQGEIAKAVEDLPEEQREVFLMRQVQNLAFKDIAEIVGVPENTVKSRMRYALERLQEALAEYREYAQQLK